MKNDKMKNQYRVNEQIRVREVRVVSEGGAEVIGRNHRQRIEQAVIVLIADRGNSLMNDIYFPMQ